MSNEIQKYRYLIETIILDESFKDAERIFTDVSGSQKEVSSYIDLFRDLSKRNKLQGIEKDISRWIKVGWEEFKEFVDSKKEVQSKREVRSAQKKDSIQVYKDEDKVVVIPLTKEASIYYGKNTRWCTSATNSENYFAEYFYIKGITLFYVLFKNGVKYACAFHPDKPDTIECFDQLDNSISYNEFKEATGISDSEIRNWYSSNKGVIIKSQDISNLDEKEQIELTYERPDIIEHIKNPSEKVQLAAVNTHGHAIRFIKNPSEAAQIAAVQNDDFAIYYITDKGIEPSEAVQLAALENDDEVIQYFIDKGIEPSEAVQLAAVKEYYYNIYYITDKGIEPSEAVQLAAVKQNGLAIEYIDNPSEEVQLAAVQESATAIEYIKNPSEKVKALQNKLYTI